MELTNCWIDKQEHHYILLYKMTLDYYYVTDED